jgi:FdhD protein
VSTRVPVVRWDLARGGAVRRPDALAVEEPLELRVAGEPVVTTMRTPGHDVDLALGWLLGEGLLAHVDDVAAAVHCTDTGADGRPTFNVLELTLRAGLPPLDLTGRRSFGVTSACGVCGAASIDAVMDRVGADLSCDPVVVDPGVLGALPATLREAQAAFSRTGGLHAAGLFTAAGDLLVAREDVGRHNAADKVLGWAAREVGLPLAGHVLVLSGRASFELVQKAWAAGVPVVAAVSAPSSLAVETAGRAGITLAGFVRPPTLNVYTHPERIASTTGAARPAG